MIKKTVLAVATALICSFGSSVILAEEEVEYKNIGGLRYHRIMDEAVVADELMQFNFGSLPENVGGYALDEARATDGVPYAFRGGKTPDEVWILDSINSALKLFKAGKLSKSISLAEKGNVADFAMNADCSKFAFLNRTTGFVYITDGEGKDLNSFKGFDNSISLEFAKDNDDLLIKNPMAKGVVRVAYDGVLKGIYEADQSLSNFESEKGIWGLECEGGTTAKLYLRTGVEADAVKIVAQFPFADYKDVEYKGGEILGFDAEGNIYFSLVACDSNGIIYRDRLYKCSQDGKVIKEQDVIGSAYMSPDLPRHKIVTPNGKVLTFATDEVVYNLCTYF